MEESRPPPKSKAQAPRANGRAQDQTAGALIVAIATLTATGLVYGAVAVAATVVTGALWAIATNAPEGAQVTVGTLGAVAGILALPLVATALVLMNQREMTEQRGRWTGRTGVTGVILGGMWVGLMQMDLMHVERTAEPMVAFEIPPITFATGASPES